MTKRTFLCIYCGNLKPWAERTEEHVIPQSLYGKFIIREVCKECNNRIGALVDNALSQCIRFAEYYKTGIISTAGVAILRDKTEVEGNVEIIEQRTPQLPYSIRRFTGSDGSEVPISSIMSVRFLARNIEKEPELAGPGIAKMAYAGIHYLLNYVDHRFRHRNFVNGPHLGGLRLFFNPYATRYVGKRYKGCSIRPMTFEERVVLLEGLESPEVRRHIILVKQDGKDIEVSLVLFSAHLWKVRVLDHRLPDGITERHAESLLPELSQISITQTKPMHEPSDRLYIDVANPRVAK